MRMKCMLKIPKALSTRSPAAWRQTTCPAWFKCNVHAGDANRAEQSLRNWTLKLPKAPASSLAGWLHDVTRRAESHVRFASHVATSRFHSPAVPYTGKCAPAWRESHVRFASHVATSRIHSPAVPYTGKWANTLRAIFKTELIFKTISADVRLMRNTWTHVRPNETFMKEWNCKQTWNIEKP
jgi:hypothetical protein